ncbi:hypothetical protein LJC07_07815 [Christensenellaceae bacterium OttesenSCG-928-L17]|nr:hypothetical protein [Christensenellaceae bacterium OttesenSCG-928-L17]
MASAKRLNPQTIELGFDALYLITVFGAGLYLLLFSAGTLAKLWGGMALMLAGGDTFHLAPRMCAIASQNEERYAPRMNTGKMVTSITMTLFYLALWFLGLQMLSLSLVPYSILIVLLAVVRVFLCLFPRAQWAGPSSMPRMRVYRNIPFVCIGAMVTLLYALHQNSLPPSLRWLWLAVLLSFAFYMPVALLSHKYPKLGMLMLPKSCVYVWMVLMGFGL